MYFGVISILPHLPPQIYVSTERGDIRQPAGTECFSPLISASSSSAKRISAGCRKSLLELLFVGIWSCNQDFSDWSGWSDLSDFTALKGPSASKYLSRNFSSNSLANASSFGRLATGK